MRVKSLVLLLSISFTTAITTLPAAVQADNEYSAPSGRRVQDISKQSSADEIVRATRQRLRGAAAEARQPAAPPGSLGVNVKTLRGALVVNVLPGSPAEKAGILAGDIILDVNKTAINSAEELQQIIAKNAAAEPLKINLTRNGRPLTLSASLAGSAGKDTSVVRKPVLAEEIDAAQTSDDPTYGFTRENPVKLGGETLREGVAASYVYLKQLRDKNRKPFKYIRVGNVGAGPDGHITDHYKLTDSEGVEFNLYIDAYHSENNALDCKAPKGMFIIQ